MDKSKTSSYNNNPYNFVPLYEDVFARWQSPQDLPDQGQFAPELYSGTIHCRIEALTPLCISDGNQGFYRNAAGAYAIPGSTLKGLVRTNMMTLGFGAMRPGDGFHDTRMLYRLVGIRGEDPRKELATQYNAVLGVVSRTEPDPNGGKAKHYSVATKVGAGYLVYDKLLNRYLIHPSGYYSVNREAEFAKKWTNSYTKSEPVWYRLNSSNRICDLQPEAGPAERIAGMLPGILLCTGRAVGKPNHLYVFPAFSQSKHPVELTNDEILTYQTDYKLRYNSLKGTDSSRHMDTDYWLLPECKDGQQHTEPWPVFYINDGSRPIYFGRSPFFRAGYDHSLGYGVPAAHQAAAEQLTLDYPYSMLGFSWKDPDDPDQSYAYRSRVSFGDFTTKSIPEKTPIEIVLGEPKASSFADYSVDGKNYNQADFRIRGIKHYWLKSAQKPDTSSASPKVIDNLTVMKEGTTFSGTIRFHQLTADELGLLLWCLKLDEGCCQTIGKGKPYGYGRSRVGVLSVQRLKPEVLYSPDSLTCSGFEPLNPNHFIRMYQDYIQQTFLHASPGLQQSVQDFMYMHSVIQEPQDVRYLTFDEYRYRTEILPSVAELRTAVAEKKRQAALRQQKEEEAKRKQEQEQKLLEQNDEDSIMALLQSRGFAVSSGRKKVASSPNQPASQKKKKKKKR